MRQGIPWRRPYESVRGRVEITIWLEFHRQTAQHPVGMEAGAAVVIVLGEEFHLFVLVLDFRADIPHVLARLETVGLEAVAGVDICHAAGRGVVLELVGIAAIYRKGDGRAVAKVRTIGGGELHRERQGLGGGPAVVGDKSAGTGVGA